MAMWGWKQSTCSQASEVSALAISLQGPACRTTHLEAHHEAARRALAAVEQACPLEAHIHVVEVQILPASLALPADVGEQKNTSGAQAHPAHF